MDRSFNSGALVKLYPTHSSANQSFQFSTVQNKYLLATADFEALDSVRISHIWAFARVCPPGAPPVPQQFNFQFLQK
jgi:hypothetical protein